MTIIPRPRVRLPSQRGLNPTLCVLLGIVERSIELRGPAVTAGLCARLSIDLRDAAQNPVVTAYVAPPLVISADCLVDAADWFSKAAICCRKACQ